MICFGFAGFGFSFFAAAVCVMVDFFSRTSLPGYLRELVIDVVLLSTYDVLFSTRIEKSGDEIILIVWFLPLMLIVAHLPSPVGSLPVLDTRWTRSSVTRIPVPPYCLLREMESSVQLLEMHDREVRKCFLVLSNQLSSDGRRGQQRPSSDMQ